MKTLKMRNISKALLGASFIVIILVLLLNGFMQNWLVITLSAAALAMLVGFVVLTMFFWRCPSCKERFKMYDLDLENKKVCPFCGANFADPTAAKIEYIEDELQK
ncbi:MAG: hypothetical protein IJF27_07750 [Oscillospiraceae bacterium]|nr:hypothetical protein [Oscillospiraceae bacterium]MBQ3048484.1 hypothetical protein [Oscillospiraceae bacterium]MBQ9938567.1 hypothetical protein [Oscillospiraceae bacterium]